MSAITIMNEDEVQRTEVAGDEAGFGCISTALGNLPVKALDVRARIVGLVYEVTVRQTYVNRYDRPLEATYIFPLPDRGAVRDFKMIVAGREIAGVLKERGAARREYQQAIEAGHRASIVEEERPDTFTMRVGNVEPGEQVTIEFKVTGPLIFADAEATFRFPLVVAPRYIPGTPLEGGNVGDGVASDTDAVPDASRITPPVLLAGFPSPIALSIDCELRGGNLDVRNVRSSLHAVTVSQGNGMHHIAIQPGERVNRDFILRFDVGGEAVQSGAIHTPDTDGEGGTFLLTLVPPAAQGPATPRDVVFVLDRSGSMSGWKMVAARRAIGRMLDTLGPRDRFGVIVFDNESTRFGSSLIDGTNRNRYRTIERLGTIEARGGTEMAQPLFDALDMLGSGYQDRRRIVVLVTDGQVGNEQQIVAGVQKRARGVSVFTVGIDQAVNAGFLNRLADIGGGRCELVESEDRLDDAMDRIHRNIDSPVLTELRVDVDGVTALSNMYAPERMPDLFAGAPVQVFGRYRGTGTPVIRASAANRDGSRWEVSVRATETTDAATTALWARQRVRALEDIYAVSPLPSLVTEITDTSLKFGVLCRFTSWVAVDREHVIEAAGDLHQVVQPVEPVAGWAPGGMAPPPPMMPMARQAFAAGAASFGRAEASRMSAAAPPPAPAPAMQAEFFAADEEGMSFEADHATAREQGAPRKRAAQAYTRAGVVPGGFDYASPEQVRGEATDLRTDVFLLGVLAFQMLTGRKLFSAINDFEILQSIVSWDPAILAREPAITGHWLAVLTKALAPRRDDRYASPRVMLEDLEARFGAVTQGTVAWPHPDDQTLAELLARGPLEMTKALWVFAWLTAAVAHLEDTTGAPVEELRPTQVNVQGATGKAHLIGHNGPGFFDKLMRWLGVEPAKARDEFWK